MLTASATEVINLSCFLERSSWTDQNVEAVTKPRMTRFQLELVLTFQHEPLWPELGNQRQVS